MMTVMRYPIPINVILYAVETVRALSDDCCGLGKSLSLSSSHSLMMASQYSVMLPSPYHLLLLWSPW